MYDRKRKHQVIPVYPDVCVLRGALSSRFSRPHKLYVANPKIVGPQACLVAFEDSELPAADFALVAVPFNAPRGRSFEDDVYGGKLSLLGHIFKTRLAAESEDWMSGPLQRCGFDVAPFGHVHWYRLLEAIYTATDAAGASKRSMPAALNKALDGLRNKAEALREAWEPLVLFVPGEVQHEELRDDMYLLGRWPEWERASLSPTRRLRAFLHFQHKGLPGAPPSLRHELNTLRHRWRFLRLKCTTKSGANWRHRLWDMWLSEETD